MFLWIFYQQRTKRRESLNQTKRQSKKNHSPRIFRKQIFQKQVLLFHHGVNERHQSSNRGKKPAGRRNHKEKTYAREKETGKIAIIWEANRGSKAWQPLCLTQRRHPEGNDRQLNQ